ncbi:phosphoribosylformimino-5-aminoimidazole carboxamide ribotide isomerase [Akkermansiaceae bacterium]|nr:phosphoribosylformimino-5-aminoimidazole carboxamide ribotide isomerase [Akkermansiaceae bacterium]
MDVQIKSTHGDLVNGALLGIERKIGVFLGATSVSATLNPHHPFGGVYLGGNVLWFRASLKERNGWKDTKKSFHEAWISKEADLSTGMAITKFRPCIDLHEGKVKQIVGGTLSDSGAIENFVSEKSPAWYAEKFARDDLRGGHVIKLGPGNDEAAREALGAWPGGLQIGGGISGENAAGWLEAGASEVIVTSWFFDSRGKFLEDRARMLADEVGANRVVIDLSCRQVGDGWKVAMNRWQTITEMEVGLETMAHLSQYCGEFLIHAADVEGQCAGVDVPLVNLLGQWTGCPVTYAGGVRGLDDLKLIHEASGGRLDATVGSALDLFGGTGVSYKCLLKWNQGSSV